MRKRMCPKGLPGTIGPKPCDYCKHGKPLIEFGKPTDDYYLKVWIDKEGKLQVRGDSEGAVAFDTLSFEDGKQLCACPMCGALLPLEWKD